MPEFEVQRATELVYEIGSLLAREPAFGEHWDGIATVAIVEPGVMQLSAFVYEDGRRPSPALPGEQFFGLFRELQDSMRTEDGSSWKSALVQIVRATGRLTIAYEHEDAQRWKLTPANAEALPEQLRPVP